MSGSNPVSTSPLSVISIFLSIALLGVGSGIMSAYVPFMLIRSGAPDWSAGAAVTAVAFGGLLGCGLAGPLIRRVGHARLFSCSVAFVILSALLIAADLPAIFWILARGLYGMASNANFIITQSWLNHAAANSWRGRAMSIFYMLFIMGLGTGAWLFGQIPTDGNLAPLATIFFTTIAILPIGLTRLPTPPAPARVNVDIAKAWRTSPVGLVGVLAAGGVSMMVQGFVPIYAAGNAISQSGIALLMFVMQFGLLVVQFPLGALSDRIDRRVVLIITCGLIMVAGFAALFVPFSNLWLLTIVLVIFAGSVETIYSLANAHANDRADPEDYVPLSSTLLVAWSVSATIVPLAVTLLTPIFGPQTFLYAAILVALAYAAFVIRRRRERDAVPTDERENFGMLSAQLPNASLMTDPDSHKPQQ